MLRSIEILGLRAIRYARLDLNGFQVLVGPNASGKSTLLDALTLVRDVLTVGIDRALRGDARFDVAQRVADPRDLTWMRSGEPVEIVLTFDLPDEVRAQLKEPFVRARYECGLDLSGALRFSAETLFLCKVEKTTASNQQTLFPNAPPSPPHIVKLPNKQAPPGWKKIVFKNPESGNDTFSAETGSWNNPFRLGPDRSALANLPADEARFPAALWVRRLVMEGVHRIQLNAEKMRLPSPAGSPTTFLPDGSNLPWVVHQLETQDPESLRRWIEHVRIALPDIEKIGTHDREEDRARYLQVTYINGLTARRSWSVCEERQRQHAQGSIRKNPARRLDLLVAVGDNDPGLFERIESYVRPARAGHSHLVVMIDAEWTGSPGAAAIRTQIVEGCVRSGWSEDDIVAVVADPELETWIWQDSPIVESAVGYSGSSLRQDLAASGAWPRTSAKPLRPKETLEAELRRNRIPRSSSLYRRVAESISVKHCVDPAFVELRGALQRWFPPMVV